VKKKVQIWDIGELKLVRKLGVESAVNDLVFTPDSKKVLMAGNKFIMMWDLLSDQILFKYAISEEITAMDLNPFGNLLVTA